MEQLIPLMTKYVDNSTLKNLSISSRQIYGLSKYELKSRHVLYVLHTGWIDILENNDVSELQILYNKKIPFPSNYSLPSILEKCINFKFPKLTQFFCDKYDYPTYFVDNISQYDEVYTPELLLCIAIYSGLLENIIILEKYFEKYNVSILLSDGDMQSFYSQNIHINIVKYLYNKYNVLRNITYVQALSFDDETIKWLHSQKVILPIDSYHNILLRNLDMVKWVIQDEPNMMPDNILEIIAKHSEDNIDSFIYLIENCNLKLSDVILTNAIQKNNINIVKYLIDNYPRYGEKQRKSAIKQAKYLKHQEIVEYIESAPILRKKNNIIFNNIY